MMNFLGAAAARIRIHLPPHNALDPRAPVPAYPAVVSGFVLFRNQRVMELYMACADLQDRLTSLCSSGAGYSRWKATYGADSGRPKNDHA